MKLLLLLGVHFTFQHGAGGKGDGVVSRNRDLAASLGIAAFFGIALSFLESTKSGIGQFGINFFAAFGFNEIGAEFVKESVYNRANLLLGDVGEAFVLGDFVDEFSFGHVCSPKSAANFLQRNRVKNLQGQIDLSFINR